MNYSIALLFLAFFNEFIVFSWQVQVRCPVLSLQNGRVRTRSRGRIIRFTCYEGFILVGNKYSTCIRGQWDTSTPVCVNAECSTPPLPEHALMAPKYNGAILMYFCEPGYTLIGGSEIYCDGRQWNGTVPYCRDTNAVVPTKCNFETPDLCWWEQDPLHDFDWRRHNFETPTSHVGTGPTHDHTLGRGNDGYYLYIEASGRLTNDTARIVSPLYNSSLTESGCFSFWYHMFGATMGGLRVYFKQESDTTAQLMFKRDGNQGNQWLYGVFDLPRVNKSFQIIIEGIRGSSYVSDIAIDDVAILQGAECKVNKTGTEVYGVTVSDEDQVELINALQTCRGRCNDTASDNVYTPALLSLPDTCQCTIDCAETSTCCPDYAEYCVLSVPDTKLSVDVTETASVIMQTTVLYAKDEITTRLHTLNQTLTTVVPGRSIHGDGILINPKDDIDPNTAVSSDIAGQKPVFNSTERVTTNRQRTTSTTLPVTRTKSVVTTRKLTPSTHSVNTTTTPYWRTSTVNVTTTRKSTTKTNPKKVPFDVTSTTVLMLSVNENGNTDSHVMTVQETQKLHRRSGSIGLPGIIAVAFGIIICTIIMTTVAFILIRRRKTYSKRGVNGLALSEDSDVRFLTSDEILDFNLARPSENDEL